MPKVLDLTGRRFGRLVVCWPAGYRGHQTAWLVLCDCGQLKIVMSYYMTSGHTTSCGCFRREDHLSRVTKHRHKKRGLVTRTYMSWQHMKNRCTNPNAKDYVHYGARGIKVCARWLTSFENFLEDMGTKPRGMTLERMNNNGNYELSNCRWATQLEQVHNRRPNIRGRKGIPNKKK